MEWFDGPCMCKVVPEQIDTTSAVNLDMHCHAIEAIKLQIRHKHVTEMVKEIEIHYKAIAGNGGAYLKEGYMPHNLTALLSASHKAFNTHLKAIKIDINACCEFHTNVKRT